MSLYIFGCILLSLFTLLSGCFVFTKYKDSSGVFYLIFAILVPFWYGIFVLSFGGSLPSETILELYRFQYSISIIGLYSALFFIVFFSTPWAKIRRHIVPIIIFFVTVFYLSNFTDLVVKSLVLSPNKNFYIEVFGRGYTLFLVLYGLLIPLFILTGMYKISTLRLLHSMRVKYILGGFVIFLILCLSFIVFIPFISSEFIFEKYIPFFLLPLVLSIVYSSHRYHFTDHRIALTKLFVVMFSALTAIIFVLSFKFCTDLLDHDFRTFWYIQEGLSWFDVIGIILIFYLIHKTFRLKTSQYQFSDFIQRLQDRMTNITTISELNYFLTQSFHSELGVSFVFLSGDVEQYPETYKYFTLHNGKYIIRDYVFFEEMKHKCSKENIQKEIPENAYLLLPLRSYDGSLQGIFMLGEKPLSDIYSTQEIVCLQSFVTGLQRHVKYMSIYREIHDLNVNLDKKVDEKTIKYNNLINKQKEFIAYVSHEIKNPVTNALFLSDALGSNMDSVSDTGLKKTLHEDVGILNQELLKIGELTHKIFSVESYDLDKVKLFREYTDMYSFLNVEIESFRERYPDIVFDIRIEQVGNYEFDRVQFRQVVQNLIGNAIKFSHSDQPKIQITLKNISDTQTIFCVEDNGNSFSEADTLRIFDKYMTGESSSIGLGLGLYLCKRIVELHSWTIQASVSQDLGGAKCTITIV